MDLSQRADPDPVAAVVLAAGRSRRMGAFNKLLVPLEGRPLVLHAVEPACRSRARPVIVVAGHEAGALRQAVVGWPVSVVENPDYEQGLATSVRTGVAALPASVAAAMFLLGDAPRVRGSHINALIDAFWGDRARPICVPVHKGRRGNPVLWPARFFPELLTLTGDRGARPLLARHHADVRAVEMADAGVLFDVDTPRDLRAAARGPASDESQFC